MKPLVTMTAALTLAVIMSAPVSADPPEMTPAEIISLASSGTGYSYWWGHGCWRTDGTQTGSCSGSCPNCTHRGSYGADCSGFVAKAWQVPGESAVSVDAHPYSTYNFYHDRTHWYKIKRSELEPGDALVRRSASSGHVMIFASKSAAGYQVYECAGCSKGCVYRTRSSVPSSYIAIRRRNLEVEKPEVCDDEQDNDGDGKVDCSDPDCTCEQSEICDDEQDNDGDGKVDCDDPECNCEQTEICGDGEDNDQNGLTDCDDPACNCEGRENCNDKEDNDGDGLIDCDDPECHCQEPEICDDQVDNDGDGLIDCLDPECNCGECEAEEIRCGAVVQGSTAGGQSNIDIYPGCSEWDESGPEKMYILKDAPSGAVSALLVEMEEGKDLDVFALENGCFGATCKEAGQREAYFVVDPGKLYYIVVDGYAGDSGSYTLQVECLGND